jgi:protein TonB
VVGKDGSISDVKILKDPGGGCGKEAVRVVGLMPKWTPGEANGNPVKVKFTLPVRFRLE